MRKIAAAAVGAGALVGGIGTTLVAGPPAAAADTRWGDPTPWGYAYNAQAVGSPGNWCMGVSRGPWVRFLQNLLWSNYLLEQSDVDGVFGPKTETALFKLTGERHRCLDSNGWNWLFYDQDCRTTGRPNCAGDARRVKYMGVANEVARQARYWYVGTDEAFRGRPNRFIYLQVEVPICLPSPPAGGSHLGEWSFADVNTGNFKYLSDTCGVH